MKSELKTIISALTLVSFLWIVLLSASSMSVSPDGHMMGDCPFSVMGVSLCPQDSATWAVDHISAYTALLNIPISGVVVTALLLLALALVASFFVSHLLLGPPERSGIAYSSPPTYLTERKIIGWLSLLEHSPSL